MDYENHSRMKTIDEVKKWSMERIMYFLQEMNASKSDFDIEGLMYTINRTSDTAHRLMKELNSRERVS